MIVYLDAERLKDKASMAEYMKEALNLPEWFGGNLDALYDCLTEIDYEVTFILIEEEVKLFTRLPYAYRTLIVISNAIEENPFLKIIFR